ncbi:MAG: alpha-E domain-containing protein [Solirubrobacteraceae bacterium]
MLARIAHGLFWLGRDLARADHTARLLDGVFHADLQGQPDDPAGVTLSWDSLLAIMSADLPDGEDEPDAPRGPAARDDVLRLLTLDRRQPASVVACVERAREGARTLRDVISTEMWEAVNGFALELQGRDLTAGLRAGPWSTYQLIKQRCALVWGLADRTMLRDEAHAFLCAGGQAESADMVLRILRVALPPGEAEDDGERAPLRDGQALALLHAVGGFQAFRRGVAGPADAVPVARFLLFDREYPNSVAANVEALHGSLAAADISPRSSPPVLRLARLTADLEFRARAHGGGRGLARTFGFVQHELALVDRDVADRYFAGAAAPERLVVA